MASVLQYPFVLEAECHELEAFVLEEQGQSVANERVGPERSLLVVVVDSSSHDLGSATLEDFSAL